MTRVLSLVLCDIQNSASIVCSYNGYIQLYGGIKDEHARKKVVMETSVIGDKYSK